MRSLLEIKTEMASILETHYEKPRERSKAQKRMQFLKMAEAYIESQPDEYFVSKEIKRLETRNNLILSQVDLNRMTKKEKRDYEKEHGVVLIRQQLKALRYIKK